MYIHVGNNVILNKKDIVAAFDIKSLINNRENLKILKILKDRNSSEEQTIIVKKDGTEIFTNISISTLRKRLSRKNINIF